MVRDGKKAGQGKHKYEASKQASKQTSKQASKQASKISLYNVKVSISQ